MGDMPPPPPAPLPPAAAPPSAVEAATKPPTAAETMPATRPEALPPIDVGAWVRAGSVFQSATDPKDLGDWHMDTSYIELHAGGKVHQNVGVTLNLNANLLHGTAGIMDAIISFDLAEPFHLWVGQLLVPVDRSNFAGPFFMIPWNYPGFLSVGSALQVAAPKEGPAGRNTGAVVWGQVNGGQFKYLVGAFDNGDATSSPLFSGRLNLAIIGTEPGFWGNSTYFGDKDVLAIGVGGQFQKHGSLARATPVAPATMGLVLDDKDYSEVNADILAEYKLGGGWVTGEGAYYHFTVSDMSPGATKDSFYLLGAIATDLIGPGHIQPMVRYQWANTVSSQKAWNLDVGLSYLVKGPALRVVATYDHTKLPGTGVTANSVQLGAQAIFF
jgi:hypothetical protein